MCTRARNSAITPTYRHGLTASSQVSAHKATRWRSVGLPSCWAEARDTRRPGSACPEGGHPCGFRRREDFLKQGQHLSDVFRIDGIIYRLRIAARLDHMGRAQLGEMLGKCRLAEADHLGQFADGHFTLRKNIENSQTLLVGHCAKESR